jgi:hypothetical protein
MVVRGLAVRIALFYAWSVGIGIVALVVVTLARSFYDAARDRKLRRPNEQTPT